jgi:hypothetical protein
LDGFYPVRYLADDLPIGMLQKQRRHTTTPRLVVVCQENANFSHKCSFVSRVLLSSNRALESRLTQIAMTSAGTSIFPAAYRDLPRKATMKSTRTHPSYARKPQLKFTSVCIPFHSSSDWMSAKASVSSTTISSITTTTST